MKSIHFFSYVLILSLIALVNCSVILNDPFPSALSIFTVHSTRNTDATESHVELVLIPTEATNSLSVSTADSTVTVKPRLVVGATTSDSDPTSTVSSDCGILCPITSGLGSATSTVDNTAQSSSSSHTAASNGNGNGNTGNGNGNGNGDPRNGGNTGNGNGNGNPTGIQSAFPGSQIQKSNSISETAATISSSTTSSSTSISTTSSSTTTSVSTTSSTFNALLTSSSSSNTASTYPSPSPLSPSSTTSRRIPMMMIVAITLGSVICLGLLLLVYILRRRRLSQTIQVVTAPFTSAQHDISSSKLSNIKLVSRVFSNPPPTASDRNGVHSNSPMTLTNSTATERQMGIQRHVKVLAAMVTQETVDQAMLRNAIAELQWLVDQYESDWAVGLTDEPPPYLDRDLVSLLERGPPRYRSSEESGRSGLDTSSRHPAGTETCGLTNL